MTPRCALQIDSSLERHHELGLPHAGADSRLSADARPRSLAANCALMRLSVPTRKFFSIIGLFPSRRVLPYMTPHTDLQTLRAEMTNGAKQSPPIGHPQSTEHNREQQTAGCIRRLLTRDQVVEILALSHDAVRQLIDTRQLTPIRISGEERIDSLDVDGLINTYKRTATRHVGTI